VRYYIYVSPAKVEMLFAQIPQKLLSKITPKFEIDLKLLKAEISPLQSQQTLYSKVDVVLDYLEQNDLVGSVDQPLGYFRGQLALRWGRYCVFGMDSGAVYFGGSTLSTILGVAGSAANVVGSVGTSPSYAGSFAPNIPEILKKELNLKWVNAAGGDTSSASAMSSQNLAAVDAASRQMQGPEQRIEFVARKLLWSDDPGVNYDPFKDWINPPPRMRVLLGSAIYAALAE